MALKVLEADAEDYNAHAKNVNIDSTLHEIKILGQLSGGKTRNVNPLLDAFSLHSQIWIVNEYCPGGSIKTLVCYNHNLFHFSFESSSFDLPIKML